MARSQPLFALLDDEPAQAEQPTHAPWFFRCHGALILRQLRLCETGSARLSEICDDWMMVVDYLKQRGHSIDCRQVRGGWLVNLTERI